MEILDLPYTGSGLGASAVAMDKVMTKRLWLQMGLPTPAFEVLDAKPVLADVVDSLGLPLIVKPPHEGSTVGLTKVVQAAALAQAYAKAARFDNVVIAERFIKGRELTVAILGTGETAHAFPIIEIIAPYGNYDYENKYFSDETRYECPAHLPSDLSARIREIALDAYRALGCEGWGRADFILDADNTPWLLEMNTSPGMTSHSLVPMAARAEGLSYADLCLSILSEASCKVHSPVRNA